MNCVYTSADAWKKNHYLHTQQATFFYIHVYRYTCIPSCFLEEKKKEKLKPDLHIHNSNYNSETKPVLASKSRSQEKKELTINCHIMNEKLPKWMEKLSKKSFSFPGFPLQTVKKILRKLEKRSYVLLEFVHG